MFKKLFGRKEKPTKDGNSTLMKVDEVRWVKKFHLELSNMEGVPSYHLTHQLTVGSEVGNIVIADPSVSPRHCTFLLQDEVVSVIDHGSVGGTLINGKKVAPGRYIILEETDTILAGDLEIKIKAENQAVQEGIPEDDLSNEEDQEAEEEVEEEKEEEEDEPKLTGKQLAAKAKENKGKGNSFAISLKSSYATNSLVRVFAVMGDVLLAYTLYVIFSPFDEFRAFVHDVPVALGDLLDLDWKGLLSVVQEEYGFIITMLEDIYSFVSVSFAFGPLILLFFMIRLISTLLFGVSITELFLGVRGQGNSIWKRIGGVLRVIIGMVTGPFLIFDVPAIVSRRTFKEFMTFTHTYLTSKFVAILGVILFLPVLGFMALFSPLLQGLEIPEPILINDILERRVKAPNAPEEGAKVSDRSEFLNLGLSYDPQLVSIIPKYKFTGNAKKLSIKTSLAFYHKDLQRTVEVEVLKTFNFQELLGIGFKGNFFLHNKYPEIYNFVYSSDTANPAFRKKINEKNSMLFAQEVVAFTKTAFGLGLENALDVMQEETPFLKGLMDYKSSFLSLVEYKEFDQIGFFKLGNGYFLRLTYNRQKPFDLLIPLIKGEGRVFKVQFDKKEQLSALTNKFYKFNLQGANWFPDTNKIESDLMSPLQVLDFFSNNFKVDKISPERAQALYGYYFEKSSEVLKEGNPEVLSLWTTSVSGIASIMDKLKDTIPATVAAPITEPAPTVDSATTAEAPAEVLPEAPTDAPVNAPAQVPSDDPRIKLHQNFQDLKDAVENKNLDYFGSEEGFSA